MCDNHHWFIKPTAAYSVGYTFLKVQIDLESPPGGRLTKSSLLLEQIITTIAAGNLLEQLLQIKVHLLILRTFILGKFALLTFGWLIFSI